MCMVLLSVVYTQMHIDLQKLGDEKSMLVSYSSPLFSVTAFLTNLGARLVASKPRDPPISSPFIPWGY